MKLQKTAKNYAFIHRDILANSSMLFKHILEKEGGSSDVAIHLPGMSRIDVRHFTRLLQINPAESGMQPDSYFLTKEDLDEGIKESRYSSFTLSFFSCSITSLTVISTVSLISRSS